MHPIPALKTLLDTSWKALAEASTRQQADRILKNTTGISTLGDHCLAKFYVSSGTRPVHLVFNATLMTQFL
jgi:hypothetical protein